MEVLALKKAKFNNLENCNNHFLALFSSYNNGLINIFLAVFEVEKAIAEVILRSHFKWRWWESVQFTDFFCEYHFCHPLPNPTCRLLLFSVLDSPGLWPGYPYGTYSVPSITANREMSFLRACFCATDGEMSFLRARFCATDGERFGDRWSFGTSALGVLCSISSAKILEHCGPWELIFKI